MKSTTYAYSTPFRGNNADALNIARVALLSLGFEVVTESDNELEATGPGMRSNRQPDLLGATYIHFELADNSINVDAVLGGVDTMKKFVYYFPPGLVISLLFMQAIFADPVATYYYLLIIPWFFIAHLMGKTFEKSTGNAIDRLVCGMAQAKTSN